MRRRLLALGVGVLLVVGATTACGQEDHETPSAPDVSRAQPTGTVGTTVAR